MNKWEKSIANITDEDLKKVADDSVAECERLKFRCEVAGFTGHDITQDKKLWALMAILESFAKRELGERMKARNKRQKVVKRRVKMYEVVPDCRDGWRLENKEWRRVVMKIDNKTDIKEQELDGTAISALIMDEPMLKNEKTENKTSDKEMLDMVLKENRSLQAQLGLVVTMCDRWFNGLSPADKIEMMARYYQLRLNCYENNKKDSK